MARMQSTAGQLLINEVLPEDLRDYHRPITKKSLGSLLSDLAMKHPDQYRDVSFKLGQIGRIAAYRTGGQSFGLRHLKQAVTAKHRRQELQEKIDELLDRDDVDEQQLNDELIKLTGRLQATQQEEIFQESKAEDNPLAHQLEGAGRGNKMTLASMRGSDLLYQDYKNNIIPVPVMRSYSQGLSPLEYWAGTYGARRGVLSAKMCLSGSTEVLMSDYTSKPIAEIRAGEWVMGANKDGTLVPTEVKHVFENGTRPCYRFTFRKNSIRRLEQYRELVCTEDHKILAQNRKYWLKSYAGNGYETQLLPLREAQMRDPLKIVFTAMPSRGEADNVSGVREPRALLAGLMLSDGCMAPSAHGSYNFSCADPLLLDDTRGLLSRFNLKFQGYKEGSPYHSLVELVRVKRKTVRVGNRVNFKKGHVNPTKRWLRNLLGECLAHEKTIPEVAWFWDRRSVCELIAGIFSGDGSITKRVSGCTIRITMTAESLVHQLNDLLELRLGIWTGGVHFVDKSRSQFSKHNQWEFEINHPVCVRRFYELIPLVGKKRLELADAVKYVSKDPASRDIGFKLIKKEYVGDIPTYDLEVAHPEHMFALANGLIVSNSTADSGFLGKQLAQITHRLLVTADDAEEEPTTLRGLPVDVTDSDSEGGLLAHPVAGYNRNTILTPKILRDIENKGFKKILVRSPTVSGSPDGGVYAKDVGIREFNRLPAKHELVGLTAAQSFSEPLTQSALSEKHSGGVASGQRQNLTGFARINQLIQVPKTFKGGAAHATIDGIVQSVEPAPAGGHFISVNGTKHYVAKGFEPTVKRGDTVEAGDVLSDGEPSPALITQYKGVGEGRKYFVDIFQKAMRDSGLKSHRRNVELLARGLINHVRMSEEYGNYAPDDVVPYSTLERNYEPRPGFRSVTPSEAVGKYLERPYLHYSIGTKIRPSMLSNMREFGIRNVDVHDDPPPFEPEMIRGMSNLQHDPDWMVRLFGSGLKSSLTKAVHRGATSDEAGTSFVPSRARAVDFGLSGAVQTPKPPKPTSLES